MGIVRVVLAAALLVSGCSPSPTPYEWSLPDGIPPPPVPTDNPMTEEKVALGRALFYDSSLSVNRAQACADCHEQANAFAEPRKYSVGATGETVPRNALALVNVAYNGPLTWAHSGLTHIEQQLMIPLFNESPVELGVTGNEALILQRFDTPQYHKLFNAAYGSEKPDWDKIVKALASFVRSLVSFDSPFDAYAYNMDDDALSQLEIDGMNLFFSERFECFHCHGGFNFTQSSKHASQTLDLRPFHNTGLYNEDGAGAYPVTDQGLYTVTHRQKDIGKFRAPTLRNIVLTAPYMHDGSISTLSEVVDFYAEGGRREGVKSPLKSPFMKGFVVTQEEKEALIAFLNSLTDNSFISNPEYGPPQTD